MSYPVRTIPPVPTAIDRQIEALAAEQHGLIGHAQAIEVGATERAIRHRRESGRWLVHRPSVYRLPGTPRGWRVDLRAAILAAGGTAVASHLSAAALHSRSTPFWGRRSFGEPAGVRAR
jgi:hypothetical protein